MPFSPILGFHIVTGSLGCLSGFVAISFRKGSRRHALAGSVFVISMLCLAASGVYLAIVKSQPGNVLGGTLNVLPCRNGMDDRPPQGRATGIFDWSAFLIILAVAAAIVTLGAEAATSPTGLMYGYPVGPYIFLGSVALLATAGDVRLLVRGGISGSQRIARHLWRMCLAFFIAAASIFLARAHVFSTLMRKSGVLYLLSFLPLIVMIFWLIRIRFKNPYEKKPGPGRNVVPSLQT